MLRTCWRSSWTVNTPFLFHSPLHCWFQEGTSPAPEVGIVCWALPGACLQLLRGLSVFSRLQVSKSGRLREAWQMLASVSSNEKESGIERGSRKERNILRKAMGNNFLEIYIPPSTTTSVFRSARSYDQAVFFSQLHHHLQPRSFQSCKQASLGLSDRHLPCVIFRVLTTFPEMKTILS